MTAPILWDDLPLGDVAERHGPGMGRLAAALCSLPFVPFETLRAVRKLVAPEVSERAFCDSPLVDGVAADGISLDPSTSLSLRGRVRSFHSGATGAGAPPELAELREVLDRYEHRLSPLLAIEERLAWLWLTQTDLETFRASADGLLRDVILTAIHERRRKIFRWASAASRRLPIECFDSEMGWMLGQLCRARRIPFPWIPPPTSGIRDVATFQTIVEDLPDRLVGIYRDGAHLELGRINPRRHVAIPVVDTSPASVTVRAHPPTDLEDGTDPGIADAPVAPTNVWLAPGKLVRLPVGRGGVTLTDLRGRTYELAAYGTREAPEVVEARQALTKALQLVGTDQPLVAEVLRRVTGSGCVVQLPEVGCSAYLHAAAAFLEPGMRTQAVVTSVIAEERRVFVRPSFLPPVPERPRFPASRVTRRPRSAVPAPVGTSLPATVVVSESGGDGDGDRVVAQIEHDARWPATAGGGLVEFRSASDPAEFRGPGGQRPAVGKVGRLVVLAETDDEVLLGLDLSRDARSSTRRESWDDAGAIAVGSVHDAEVLGVVNFGAFLLMPDGRHGLLHISEMRPPQRSGHVPYQPGEVLRVEVVDVDLVRRRISLRQMPPWRLEEVTVGMRVRGRVVREFPFGVHVHLSGHPVEGFRALLHQSEIPGFAEGHELGVGVEVEATVIRVERSEDRDRLSLGSPRRVDGDPDPGQDPS